MSKIMKCGHVPNAMTSNGKECCVICLCTEYANEEPNLEGRTAVCGYCSKEEISSTKLPFFEYRANEEKDSFYDGCRGWD